MYTDRTKDLLSGNWVNRMIFPILAILVVVFVIFLGSFFSEPISKLVQRLIPDFSYESETFLLAGLLVIAAFAIGLVVMYVLLHS